MKRTSESAFSSRRTKCSVERLRIRPRRTCRERIYPLVTELANDGIPVTVTRRVLKLCRQHHYRWRDNPVTDPLLDEAHLTNAILDAHAGDPKFGFRFLADEIRAVGFEVCDQMMWRICRDNGWSSVIGKKNKKSKPGAPAHDDLVKRDFTAAEPDELWLADITEHWTKEGKLYLCAIKGVWSSRIVGCSFESRMKAPLAVNAIDNAVARRRGDVAAASCTLTGHRKLRSRNAQRALVRHGMVGSMSQVGSAATTPQRNRSSRSCRERPHPAHLDRSRRASDRDRDLDRTHLSLSPPAALPRPFDPDRLRDHHDPNTTRCPQSPPVTETCSRPVEPFRLASFSD